MNRKIAAVLLFCGMGLALQPVCATSVGALTVTGLKWNRTAKSMDVSITAPASIKARTVYVVWGVADCGDDFRDWEHGEILGTLAAGTTSATYTMPQTCRNAFAYRVYTFDATASGDGYLDHVEATGAQAIDTGVYPDYQSSVVVDYKWTNTQGQQRVFGTQDGDFVLQHYISGTSATGGCLAYACKDSAGNWTNYGTVVDKNRVTVRIDSYTNNYAGAYSIERDCSLLCDKTVSAAVATSSRTKTASKTFTIFCAGTGSDVASWRGKFWFYRLRLGHAGTLQHDYFPYIKNGVAGVYDRLTDTFLASGTGTALVAGTRLGMEALEASAAIPMPLICNTTFKTSYLPGGQASDLGNVASLLMRNGTLKYTGRDDERAYYDGDVELASPTPYAANFDITGDLTLLGRFESQNGQGAFEKTGPGTLRIPGCTNEEYVIYGGNMNEPENMYTNGIAILSIQEGRVVLGENGGRFKFVRSGSSSDLQIGKMTVDPYTHAGEQEKDAVLEVAGGTTIITNWTVVGGKNGFVTTCPEKVPESGVRVTGGKLCFMGSLVMGRNKSSAPQKDGNGNYIAQRTRPFLEVLGGELQIWNTSRVGFCDDPGADTRVLVDKGTLIVRNYNNTTGAGIVLGCCTEGVATAPRLCEITVRNGGRFDCSDYYINGSAQNVTSRIDVVDGGIYRNNIFRKVSTRADCWTSIAFDGGIAEIRWGGYPNWIASDVSRVSIGTHGAIFRSDGCDWNVLDTVCVPIEADDTYPGETPQGLTISYSGADRNAGFVFARPNTYKGPTTIGQYGRLEFRETGAFPSTSDVTLGRGGRLALTNIAHTVKSFTLGDNPALELVSVVSMTLDKPLTAGACAAVGSYRTQFNLYSAPGVPLASAGEGVLLKAPAADITAVRSISAQAFWGNPTNDLSAVFSAAVEGDEAVLRVTVSADAAAATHPAAGGTETLASLEAARDAATGFVKLGTGTVLYTGSGEVISGLVNAAGSSGAAILNVQNDLTLLDFTDQAGRFYKTGPGDLYLMGTGEFVLGMDDRSYDSSKPQGIDADGNPPNNASQGFSVADGRVIIGQIGDAANAPHVIIPSCLAIGTRTAARDSGKMETTGELIMNNGTLDLSWFGLSYYNGYPETTPPEGLYPKFTINGGTVNLSNNVMSIEHDYEGFHGTSPTFTLNGGLFNAENSTINFSPQVSTGRVDNVVTFTQNGGEFRCKALNIGSVANAAKTVLNLNGGDLYFTTISHSGDAASTNKGCVEAHFNGTVLHPGYGRSYASGMDFMSYTAKCRFNTATIGKGGLILDFDAWKKNGLDGSGVNFTQPFLHDPDCEGADGGITFRNGNTVIMRNASNGCTFTGPVTLEGGTMLGVDNGATVFDDANRMFAIGPGCGLRMSGQLGWLPNATFGTTDAMAPVLLDFCTPDGTTHGCLVKGSIRVLSPMTVSFHRNGGSSNTKGVWLGTTDVLYYPASEDANVPLELFVANAELPTVTMTFAKEDVTTGTYAGYKKISVTIANDYAAGTKWISTAAGGSWQENANWENGVPVDATNAVAYFAAATGSAVPVNVTAKPTAGRLTLEGADATRGYAFSGEPINFHRIEWNKPGDVVAVSGTHTIANDLVTDNSRKSQGEAESLGTRTGAIHLSALSNATLTVAGSVAPDAEYRLYVNPETNGGGTTVFAGTLTQGAGVTLQSGTMEVPDFGKFNNKAVTIGPATLHVTGSDRMTESPIIFASGSTTKTAVIRNDNRLVVNANVTTTKGMVIKTGPGELVLNGTGCNNLGAAYSATDWNSDRSWPSNGDSLDMGGSPFCLDEGTVTFGRAGQHMVFGSSYGDIFIGSQRRGWAYTTDKVTLNMMGGSAWGSVMSIGHGMRRGTTGDDLAYVEFNQYGGVFTNAAHVYIGYELTKYDSHIRASMNLYGGVYQVGGFIRLGQTYNKTSQNEPYSKLLVDGGTLAFTRTSDLPGNIYVPHGDGLWQLQQSQSRATDAELTIKSGMITNAYLIAVGQNGGRGEVHLDGGLVNCENLVHHTAAQTGSADYYKAFDVADGTSHVYFNGGVFQPISQMWTAKDAKACLAWNATLTNFTELVVQSGGAKFDLSALVADAYTIAQTITGAEGDGGLVKSGAKPLVLAARCTYFGETTIGEGTLRIGAAAPEGDILPNSTLRLKAGAALEFEDGAKATISKLVVDCQGDEATIVNLKAANNGTIKLENAPADFTQGALPVLVSGSKAALKSWTVSIDGETVPNRCLTIDGTGHLAVIPPPGMVFILR